MKAFITFLTVAALAGVGRQAIAQPIPPCVADNTAVAPFYGDVSEPPVVRAWHDVEIDSRHACLEPLWGQMALVVVLAGRFDRSKSVDDIAARIGAISASKGLKYWSTTARRWRTLISEAFALEDPVSRDRRPDFTAREVLSGRTLYFGQNDTRSTGLNVYSLTAKSDMAGRLVVEIINLTAIRFVLATLFEPGALRSVHFFDRLQSNVWGYYGISAVRSGAVEGHEKSFINRADALYRLLIGAPTNAKQPLAP